MVKIEDAENRPSGAEAHVRFVAFAARLKSCPFKTWFSQQAGKK
jgi:hypothetical protein